MCPIHNGRFPLDTHLLVLVLVAFLAFPSWQLHAEPPPVDSKNRPVKALIQWGWDEPNTSFIRTHVRQMEKLPFDGLVFHADSQRGGNFTWSMWGGRRFELDEFQQSIRDLQATRFRKLQHRFLRVNVTPGHVDWFDDDRWADVLQNFQVAAQIAKQGRCRGFMFDVEQYEHPLFDFDFQKHQGGTSRFDDYRRQVRQRGEEWIKTVNQQFPDITILLTFAFQMAQPRENQPRSKAPYALLADFLDGILTACSPETKIVDAWEPSYSYRTTKQFNDAYQAITSSAPAWSVVPDRYRKHVEAGFGIWMDYDWRKNGWDTSDFSQNFFTPQQFEKSVRAALQRSDQFVWIYTEQPRWWTKEKLPQPYIEALRRVHANEVVPR